MTEKHVQIGVKGDIFGHRTFEVWRLLEHVLLKWRVSKNEEDLENADLRLFFNILEY